MAKDPKPIPKTEYESALGPIPPDHFDDDLPFNADVDKSPGSAYDHAAKRIREVTDKAKK